MSNDYTYRPHFEPPAETVELTGNEVIALKSMSELTRLIGVLYKPRAMPRDAFGRDDRIGRQVEFDDILQTLVELGNRLAAKRV